MRFPKNIKLWTKKRIIDFCEVNPKTEGLENKFVYIDLESVDKGCLLAKNIISKNNAPSRAQRVLKNNDILFQCVRPYQMNNLLFKNGNDTTQYVASTGYAQLRTQECPFFVYQLLHSPNFNKDVMLRCTGSSYPAISSNDLENIETYICDIEEQQKIGGLLDLIDGRIKTQNKIISKYETLIKGLCDCLLSEIEKLPSLKLSEVLVEYNDKTKRNDEYPILSSTMNGIFVQSDYFNKQAASGETIGYKKVPYGYCTYRSMSDTGEFRFNIQKTIEIGIVSPAYPVFTSQIYNIDFIAFYLNNSSSLKKQILATKEGGTRFALSYSKLSNLTIPIITRLEQNKIIDEYYILLRKKEFELKILRKLKEQKKYLLSKMFI